MGTWNVGPFDNDDAQDLLDVIRKDSTILSFEAALDKVILTGEDYLEAPEAQQGIAAAGLIAQTKGEFETKFDANIDSSFMEYLRSLRFEAYMYEKSHLCIRRILRDPSELMDLWKDSPQYVNWKLTLESILERLDAR